MTGSERARAYVDLAIAQPELRLTTPCRSFQSR